MRTRYWSVGPDWGKAPSLPYLETEENPVVGKLLGPSGSTLKVVRAKATIPFGPQPSRRISEED